jgi:hypothetical protein
MSFYLNLHLGLLIYSQGSHIVCLYCKAFVFLREILLENYSSFEEHIIS